MKKLVMMIVMVLSLALTVNCYAQWNIIRVNTNTWETKPHVDSLINLWNEYGGSLVGSNYALIVGDLTQFTGIGGSSGMVFIANGVGTGEWMTYQDWIGTLPPATPSTTNNIPSYYEDAAVWYSFTDDSISPSIWDNSGSRNHGLKGPSSYPTSYPTWTNYSMKMDDILEGFIQTASSNILDYTAAITISLWINYYETPEALDSWIRVNDTSGVTSGNNIFLSGIPPNNEVYVWFFGYDDYFAGISGEIISFSTGVWHHFVATYEKKGPVGLADSIVTVYENGVLESTANSTLNFFVKVEKPWVVGKSSSPGLESLASFNAYVDDIAILPVVWSAGTVYTVYTNGRSLGISW